MPNLHAFTLSDMHAGIFKFNFYFDNSPVKDFFCAITSAGDMSLGFPNPNRDRVFAALNIEPVFAVKQTHSRDVVLITQDDTPCEADGAVSKHGYLTVTVADCLPVYLLDTESGAFAVLHSGRKGTGIAHNAICMMQSSFNTKPENIAAVLGPCIQSCCHEVDAECAAAFATEFGGGVAGGTPAKGEAENRRFEARGTFPPSDLYPLGDVVKTRNGKFYVDMQAANAHILIKDGVQNIAYCTNCTFDDVRLGSYRRQGAASYTKMMAIAGRLQ
jgi:YfiH family protein